MTDDTNDGEDPDITRMQERTIAALGAGVLIAIAGGISATIGYPDNVEAIAGGWTAVGTGALLASVGGGAASNHARILRRSRRHHEAVMGELDGIRAMLASPAGDLERRRNSR